MERILKLLALVSCVAFARPVPDGDLSGKPLRYIGQTPLFLKGTAVHHRYFFEVYELSLYVQDLDAGPDRIISSVETKYARLRFLRSLKAKEIRDAFLDTFRENCLNECQKLSPQLKTFLESIPNMSANSVIEFVFYPEKTSISTPTETISFLGVEFGQLLLRAWLGSHPPSERFKRKLLGS